MPSTKSRVHPKYKTKYRVSNWAEYDLSLVERGNLTIWLSSNAIARWNAKPSRRRGGQRKYSDLAIETALTLYACCSSCRCAKSKASCARCST
ncbi:MAG TPA: hypothetical protein EYP98_18415 [Planctomycetes bacterium]|nr:hypothetical protein [Planctomycetota bacterium]